MVMPFSSMEQDITLQQVWIILYFYSSQPLYIHIAFVRMEGKYFEKILKCSLAKIFLCCSLHWIWACMPWSRKLGIKTNLIYLLWRFQLRLRVVEWRLLWSYEDNDLFWNYLLTKQEKCIHIIEYLESQLRYFMSFLLMIF